MGNFEAFGNMKTRWLIFAVVLLPTFGLSGGFSVRNPAIRNPVGNSTAPVSSYSSGLINTPVPIDATADLSITGNLRHGKHFRGNVPYRSVSDLSINTGSSSINSFRSTPSLSSFLRDSAGSEDFGRRSRVGFAARPYYSPYESVARTVPGRAEVLPPRGTGSGFDVRQNGYSTTNRLFTMESMPKQQVATGRETTAEAAGIQRFQTQYGPLNETLSTSEGAFIRGISPGSQNMERLTPGQADTERLQNDKVTLERLREQSRRPLIDPRQASRLEDRAGMAGDDGYRFEFDKSSQTGVTANDAATDRFQLSHTESFKPSMESAMEQDAVQSQTESEQEYSEVLSRIKQQLDELSKSVESRLQTRPDDTKKVGGFQIPDKTNVKKSEIPRPAPKSDELSNLSPADSTYRLKVHEPRFDPETFKTTKRDGAIVRADKAGQNQVEYPSMSGMRTAAGFRAIPEDIGELSRTEMSREAKRIIGGHKNHDSFAADKFSRHMRDAEDRLRAGKYYKAADSYTLALVYSPDDPQALAGRSHALFAAGEYISSALFLTRALAINPEYAKVRVDFVKLLGGSNRLAGRVADIERWFARSGSGRLQLLLGYVYYQTGRISEAKRAVEAAGTKMPRSPAVRAIVAAISDAATGQ